MHAPSPFSETGKVEVVFSETDDPKENLAFEARLLREVEGGLRPSTLFFYVDSTCLVKGCTRSNRYGWYNEELAAKLKIPVYERITGGGVVFHDPGNLNWCFVLRLRWRPLPPRLVFEEGSKHIVGALRRLGLDARFAPPNRIDLAGFKVSGMAARSTLGALLVHGTLLVESDLELLRALCVPPEGMPDVANIVSYRRVGFGEIVCEVLRGLKEDGFEVCWDGRAPAQLGFRFG